MKKSFIAAMTAVFTVLAAIGYSFYKHNAPFTPLAQIIFPRSEGCRSSDLALLIRRHSTDFKAQAKAIDRFFQTCDKELAAYAPPDWYAMWQMSRMVFNLNKHPNLESVTFELENGEVVPGLLGLKPGDTPRPMIILKCGFLCNSKTGIPFTIMHFFDEGPFHVLFLGNASGAEWAGSNHSMIFGGFHEGMQILRVAKKVRNGPSSYAHKISSLHFLGVSLGGQGALYANLYQNAELNINSQAQRTLDSVTAVCPVVNLKPTLEANFSKFVSGQYIKRQIWTAVNDVLPKWPEVKKYFPDDSIPLSEYPELLATGAVDFLRSPRISEQFLPPFEDRAIKDNRDFWFLNNYLNHQRPFGQTPLFAIGAQNDRVVPPEANLSLLASRAQQTPYSNTQVVMPKNGSHCSFSLIYGWDIAGTLLRELLLSRSPEFSTHRQKHKSVIETSWPHWTGLNSEDQYIAPTWSWDQSSQKVQLTLNFLRGGKFTSAKSCLLAPSWSVWQKCYKSVTTNVDLSHLDLPLGDKNNSHLEAQILTRWLNANLRVHIDSKKIEPSLSKLDQLVVSWTSF